MKKHEIIKKLRDDKHYYGKFGKQYLSNSDIYTLLNNPLAFGQPSKGSPAFLMGGYFHTAILEPNKLDMYSDKIINATSRNSKVYKDAVRILKNLGAEDSICLLQSEVDNIERMIDVIAANDVCNSLIRGIDVEYEKPNIGKIFSKWWKGKADVVNHDEQLIVDLKTTSDISRFRRSAWKFNYDSQAYIYKTLFGYEFVFIAIDKNTHQIGIFDCSRDFYESGKDKVEKAVAAHELFYNTEGFDPKQYFLQETL